MDSFKHTISTSGAGQKTKQQCWYASYKMILKSTAMASDMDRRLRGILKTDLDGNSRFDDALANGLLDTDYRICAIALGLQSWSGTLFKKPAGFFDVGLTDGAEAFLAELKKRPLWVSRWTGNGYHAVVATGYNDRGKGYIIFNNPYPGPTDAIEDSTCTANNFVKFITDAHGSVQGVRVP
ncbi:MAG: papain-like cysteine protease family protein [Planctomycetaceae bacterium]